MKPSEADLAWVAGVIEGDGSVFIEKNRNCGKGHRYDCPTITVVMGDRKVVEEIKKILGGRVYLSERKGVNRSGIPRHRDMWKGTVTWISAERNAAMLLPYVRGEKREKLKEIIDFHNARMARKNE